ncbi:MAG: lipopolysaccharide heptosyltransferase II [Verrucomicrobia bacterium]|nr:lipopolysaccharide heptosyltransferase II [Verrucomicrobiota bacterium]
MEMPERFLIIGPDRVGDSVLSLPALQLLRQEHPAVEITMTAGPKLEAFWNMCPSIDGFQTLEEKFPNIGKLKQTHYDRVYILSNSFRSAWIPFVAGIPRRIGARGHWRLLLLTEVVHLGSGHQQFEAMSILGVQGDPPAPELRVPPESFQTLERKLVHFPNLGKNRSVLFQALEADTECPMGARPVITILPGAPHDPSRRWPATHFLLLARNLCSALNAVVLLGGGPEDAAVCAEIAATEPGIINLAGETTLAEWAALLKASHCVVGNESGGTHLASALGTPVVGLYGLTDPKKTGPLGKHIVFQKREPQGRNAPRDSDAAARALALIGADEVFMAVRNLLAGLR